MTIRVTMERERDFLPVGSWPWQLGLGQAEVGNQELHSSLTFGSRYTSAWTITYYCLGTLAESWTQNTNHCSNTRYEHSKCWLNSLWYNTYPTLQCLKSVILFIWRQEDKDRLLLIGSLSKCLQHSGKARVEPDSGTQNSTQVPHMSGRVGISMTAVSHVAA